MLIGLSDDCALPEGLGTPEAGKSGFPVCLAREEVRRGVDTGSNRPENASVFLGREVILEKGARTTACFQPCFARRENVSMSGWTKEKDAHSRAWRIDRPKVDSTTFQESPHDRRLSEIQAYTFRFSHHIPSIWWR